MKGEKTKVLQCSCMGEKCDAWNYWERFLEMVCGESGSC